MDIFDEQSSSVSSYDKMTDEEMEDFDVGFTLSKIIEEIDLYYRNGYPNETYDFVEELEQCWEYLDKNQQTKARYILKSCIDAKMFDLSTVKKFGLNFDNCGGCTGVQKTEDTSAQHELNRRSINWNKHCLVTSTNVADSLSKSLNCPRLANIEVCAGL